MLGYRIRLFLSAAILAGGLCACAHQAPTQTTSNISSAPSVSSALSSDPRAVELVNRMIERLGGASAWDGVNIVAWQSFDRHDHVWNKATGIDRIEYTVNGEGESNDHMVVMIHLEDRTGSVWKNGESIINPSSLQHFLNEGYEYWFNDHFWLSMPFELDDPGVTLQFAGEGNLFDGRDADLIDATFPGRSGVYRVYIAEDSHVVEQCAYFSETTDTEPVSNVPWTNWREYRRILLCDDHGPGRRIRDLSIYHLAPLTVWTSPEPVDRSQWER